MRTKFSTWMKSFFDRTKNISKKGPFWSIAVLLLTITIIFIAYENHIDLPSQEKMDVISNLIVLILQFIGLLLIVLFLLTIVRWMVRKQEGTLILPFDIPLDDKTNSGKAIVDALIAERYRLLHIDRYEKDIETVQNSESGMDKNESVDPEDASKGQMKQKKARSKIIDSLLTNPRVKDIKTPPQNINSNLTNVTVKVGETSFSVGQIIADMKRLWSDSQPQFIITGSLQKYRNGLKLIVRRESEIIEVWEAANDNPDGNELQEIVKEIAFKIVNAELGIMESPDNFKLYVAANEHYRQYLVTNNKEELQNACTKIISALSSDSGIKNPPKLLEKLFFACYQNEDYDVASEICMLIINLGSDLDKPILSDLYNYYGNCCEALQKFQAAASAYLTAKITDEKNLFSYYYLTLLYSKFRESDGLKILGLETIYHDSKIFETINEATSRGLVDSYTLGEWYKELHLFPEAKKAYQDAIIENNDNIDLYYSVGNTLQELGDNVSAIAILKKALELAKKNKVDANYLASICNDLAIACSQSEDGTNEAIEFYKNAIIEDPLLAVSYSNAGIIYEAKEKLEDAMGLYYSALQLDPYSINFATQLALINNRLDHNEEAISFLKPMIEINQDSSELHSLLGLIYRDNGEFKKAIEEYELAIKLDLKNSYAWRDLGYVYVGNNLIEKALDAFQESLKLDNHLRYTHAAKAACFKRLGKISEYEDEVNDALQLELEDGETEYNQASFEALCCRTNEALKLLKIALKKRQHTPAYAGRDWDFDFIKDDPGFMKLISAD